ncbi:hypothetical protein CE91St38_07750 [Desulfovibrionaceae bacterium]|nr:hypothetical protein CE91St38_07750 [Desulfovibrionaceae bacterium]GKI11318.1 hypothetical protein CE91St39_07720 [Desulfovibrionaceae bacterium]
MTPDIDFYVVSPHGAGMQSFLYCINLMGIPSTHWRWHFSQRKFTIKNYPLPKSEHIYHYGLTIDRKLEKKISYGNKNQNIFWLMRDPVALITSHINHGIGHQINPFNIHNGICGLNNKTFDRILEFKTTLRYSSQLKTVVSYGNVLPIDTQDLSADKIYDTLVGVSRFMNIKMPSGLDNIIKIPYNAYKNRLYQNASWINLNSAAQINPRILFEEDISTVIKKTLLTKLKKYIENVVFSIFPKNGNRRFGKISFCKSFLYDFYFNQWKKHYIIDTKNVNGEIYTIFCDSDISPPMDEDAFNIVRNYIHYYEQYVNYILSIWNNKKITCHDVIQYLHNNIKYYDKLLFLLDAELACVQSIAEDKLEKWNYYHELCRA